MPLPYSLFPPEPEVVYLLQYSTGGVPLLTRLVWVEVPGVAVTILLISNLWINHTISGSTPSAVRVCVIAMGSTLLKAPSMSRKASE